MFLVFYSFFYWLTHLRSLCCLQSALLEIDAASSTVDKARLARELRLETMEDVRKDCDAVEAVCPAADWTLPTYSDMLFLDQTTDPSQ